MGWLKSVVLVACYFPFYVVMFGWMFFCATIDSLYKAIRTINPMLESIGEHLPIPSDKYGDAWADNVSWGAVFLSCLAAPVIWLAPVFLFFALPYLMRFMVAVVHAIL